MLQETEALLAKAPHWQIFVLLIGLWLLPRYVWVGAVHPIVVASMSALFLATYLMWLWVILKITYEILPTENTIPLTKITKLFLFIGGWSAISTLMISVTGSATGLMRLLNIASFFGMVYLTVIVAKHYVKTQTDSPITYMDYAGIALLLWIFPLGIWLVQPAVNKMFTIAESNTGFKDEL